MAEAMENCALGMFGYMTDLGGVGEECVSGEMRVEGADLEGLLMRFLEEWLYTFHGDGLISRKIEVGRVEEKGGGGWECETRGWGENWDPNKHIQGTEVKAITYSNLQVNVTKERTDIYVIVDI